jgi:excinuclease ABC subunit C
LLYDKTRYDLDILNAKSILSGTLNPVYEHLKAEMKNASDRYEFEKANEFKSKIQILENYKSKSLVCSSTVTNLDIFSYLEDNNTSYINYFRIVNGSIVTTYFLEIRKKMNESREDILSFGIIEIRKRCNSESIEVVLPFGIGVKFSKIKITIPQIGEKKKLLELCEKNGRLFMLERLKNESIKSPVSKRDSLLERIQKDLRLTRLPHWIECFDNSNISGEFPVASCVVFKDAKPHKSQYRHFNIKTVDGPNDFASMIEIVRRRYSRQLSEGNQLPDLILIDGGKGQLSAAFSVLVELGIEKQVQMIGIAKKLEELYFPGDSIPLYLDKKSETLMVLQKLRDEAHRFGITFHRNQRSKDFTKSALIDVPGLGPKTVERLLKHFKSLSAINSQNLEELSKVIGRDKSEKVLSYFTSKNN